VTGGWPGGARTLVDYGRLLHAITSEGQVLAEAARGARADLAVPGCPGLTLGATVTHASDMYRRAMGWLHDSDSGGSAGADAGETDLTVADIVELGDGRVGDAAIDGYRDRLRVLVSELAVHDPEEPCSTWWPQHPTYGFWRRRMAHEAAVHRADVQGARNVAVTPVDDDFAADGIDEVLSLWFVHRLRQIGMAGTTEGAVGVRAAGRGWLALLGPRRTGSRRVSDADVRVADATVTGTPTNVYLWLWGRVSNQAVQIDGDDDATGQFWALLRTATQGPPA
jgi:uncharacterized protein (TIGR03083 family)